MWQIVSNLVFATPYSLPPSAKIRFSFLIEIFKKKSLNQNKVIINVTIKSNLQIRFKLSFYRKVSRLLECHSIRWGIASIFIWHPHYNREVYSSSVLLLLFLCFFLFLWKKLMTVWDGHRLLLELSVLQWYTCKTKKENRLEDNLF